MNAIIGAKADGIVTSWNRHAERVYGYTADEIIGRSINRLVPPERRDEMTSMLSKIEHGDALNRLETVHMRADGELIDVEVTMSPIIDSAGRIVGAAMIAQDVTRQKQAQDAPRKSEQETWRILDDMQAGVLLADPDGRIEFCNLALLGMLGLSGDQLLGKRFSDLPLTVIREDGTTLPVEERGIAKVIESGQALLNVVLGLFHPEADDWVWLLENLVPQFDADGALQRIVATFTDITERKRAENKRHESEARFRALFERAPIGIELADKHGRLVATNPALHAMLGYSEDELRGRYFGDLSHPDDIEAELEMDKQLDRGELQSYILEKRFIRKNGAVAWGRLSASDVGRIDDDSFQFSIGMIEDITERRKSEERYRSVVEASLDGIIVNDLDGVALFANQQAATLLGYGSPAEILGKHHSDLTVPDDHPSLMAAMDNLLRHGRVEGVRLQGLRRDGTTFPGEVSGSLMLDDAGHAFAFTAVIRDITERQAYEAELRHQALHDPLIGIANRTLFRDRLGQMLITAQNTAGWFAILLLDLDRFKEVNDALGHDFGDRLLRKVAERLQGALPESTTVARLGGDEFAVLVPSVDEYAALRVADAIVASLGDAFVLDEHTFYIDASIGIVVSPEHGTDVETLMRRADVAMYAAKRRGGTCVVYEAGSDPHTGERLRLITDLRHAIDNGELVLHYQPQINLRTGAAEQVEALVRWAHPTRGFVPPDQFIELAEQTGLIRALTQWVLNEAVRQVARWRDAGLNIAVAINLSARNLHERDLVSTIAKVLKQWDVDPSSLAIEITESVIMSDPDLAMSIVTDLHQMGMRIAIDDFGTGYSSLAYLKRLPVDEIKIDRSFVLDMQDNSPESLCIVRSVIDLGHNLGLEIVAEGVETQAAVDTLEFMGCDWAQGYYLSRPIAPEQYLAWLHVRTEYERDLA